MKHFVRAVRSRMPSWCCSRAMILLPLLWVVRVSLTDKLTAYKIPPEIGTLGLDELRRRSSRDYPFTTWFFNSLIVALGDHGRSRCRWRRRWPMRSRAATPAASPLRLGVLASQMLPPIILVLPLFGMFLTAGLMQSRARPHHRASHHLPAVPVLDAGVVLRGRRRAAGGGGAGRRRHALAGLHQDRGAGGGARHAGGGLARLHPELERVPVRAGAERRRTPRPCRSALRASKPMPASRSRRSPPRPSCRCCRCSCCCRSCASI